MGQIVLGLVLTAGGAFLIVKTEWFIENFGRIAWFEEKLGSDGGSRLGYKLIGIILLFLGIMTITGSGGDFMRWLLAPLLRYN